MKRNLLIFAMAAATVAGGQTPAKSNSQATTAKPGTAAHSTTGVQLPPGIPRVHGIVKTAFTLRYEDYKVGTGAEAEPNKLYKVLYTGYLAADGHKFDSSDDHRRPVLDKDNKPVMGPDGKPKMGDPEPLTFPQGFGRLIPGFDQGFTGMKVGGKRRLFIPWQLAYGARGRPGPDAAHPGIPPKADLIFDVELVDVSDMPMPNRPGMTPRRPMPPVTPHPAAPGAPGAPPAPGAAPNPAAPPTAPAPGAPSTPPQGQAAPSSTQPSAPAAPPQSSAPATAPQQPAQPQPQTPPQPQ